MRIFSFYLDAYHFCVRHGIDTKLIVKKSFREWSVNTEITE
jgi:hypothetical protein